MCLPNQADHYFLLRVRGQGKSGAVALIHFLQFYRVAKRCVTSDGACILHIILRLS